MNDLKYSQNFYRNKSNIQRLVKKANFKKEDIILDIGAGKGMITKELCEYSDNVIAYELDNRLFDILKKNITEEYKPKVIFKKEDFLTSSLPNRPFKIFSNIPFIHTADIVNKITEIESNLEDAYIFVQKEAGERFMEETQISTILNSRYTLSVFQKLDKKDFEPMPDIDIVVMRIKKDLKISIEEYVLYRDFVTYVFNQSNRFVGDTLKKLFTVNQWRYISRYLKENNIVRPLDISNEYFLELFKYFRTNGKKYIERVKGYYLQNLKIHSKREKVFRRRV